MECIFCKIVNWEIPAEKVYEDDSYIAFNDINPKTPVHILIIPKKHIKMFHSVDNEEDKNLIKWMYDIAWHIIQLKNLKWCNLLINSGSDHWQEVFHIHLHLMSKYEVDK